MGGGDVGRGVEKGIGPKPETVGPAPFDRPRPNAPKQRADSLSHALAKQETPCARRIHKENPMNEHDARPGHLPRRGGEESQAFDPLAVPLKGCRVIEASAGTGKSYGIAGLYERMVCLERLSVDRIAVVTFTKAAAAELRGRLLERLQLGARQIRLMRDRLGKEAAQIDTDPPQGEELERLLDLGLKGDDKAPTRNVIRRCAQERRLAETELRLEVALNDFDRARIATLHGFFLKALKDEAFACGSPFNVEIDEDEEGAARRAARDFWLREVAADPVAARYARAFNLRIAPPEQGSSFSGTNFLQHFIIPWLRSPGMRLQGFDETLSARDLLKTEQETEQTLRRCIPLIQEEIDAAEAIGVSKISHFRALSGDLAPGMPLDRLARGEIGALGYLSHCLGGGRPGAAGPRAKVYPFWDWPAAALHGWTYKKTALPDPEDAGKRQFLDESLAQAMPCAREASRAMNAFLESAQAFCDGLLGRAMRATAQELKRAKAKTDKRFFSGILTELKRAVDDPRRGDAVASALAASCDAVLIDEFQDTDQTQYGIVKKAFIDKGTPTFLIGDPKQSIYRFRGADVYAYINAARENADQGGGKLTLRQNYRSHDDLVQAVNAMFGQNKDPFALGDAIGFESARTPPAGPQREKRDRRAFPAVSIRIVSEQTVVETDPDPGSGASGPAEAPVRGAGRDDPFPETDFDGEGPIGAPPQDASNGQQGQSGESIRQTSGPAPRRAPDEAEEQLRIDEKLTQAVAIDVANRIRRALRGQETIGGRPLKPGDVAVITRSNRKAEAISRELSRLGVGNVVQHNQNVFAGKEARVLYALMRWALAPSKMDHLRFALTSPLFGYDAQALIELQNDVALTGRWIELGKKTQALWRQGRFHEAFSRFLRAETPRSGERGSSRGALRGQDDGNAGETGAAQAGGARFVDSAESRLLCARDYRALTNLGQLLEILAERSAENASPEALADWLRDRISGDQGGEEWKLRLENDEELVQIVTAHRSKGLQYPIVYLPEMGSTDAAFPQDQDENPLDALKHPAKPGAKPLIFHGQAPANAPTAPNAAAGNGGGAGETEETREDGAPSAAPLSETMKAARLATPDDRRQAQREELSEDMRLLYVALTRAKEQVVVYVARGDRKSKVGGIPFMRLFAESEEFIQAARDAEDVKKKLKEMGSEVGERLTAKSVAKQLNRWAFNRGLGEIAQACAVSSVRLEPEIAFANEKTDLTARFPKTRAYKGARNFASFTGLTRSAHSTNSAIPETWKSGEGADVDEGAIDESEAREQLGHEAEPDIVSPPTVSPASTASPAAGGPDPRAPRIAQASKRAPDVARAGPGSRPDWSAEAPLAHFAKGKNAGYCMHETLQRFDFGDSAERQADWARNRLRRWGYDEEKWLGPMLGMLDAVAAAPLGPKGETGPALRDIPPSRRFAEMDFMMFEERFSRAELAQFVRRCLPDLPEAGAALEKMDVELAQTRMKGAIDMLAILDVPCGKADAYLIDYKSNYLGDKLGDYGAPSLNDSVLRSRYFLQALIYAQATLRLADSSGVELNALHCRYFYLRGVCADPRLGIWRWDIPVDALRRLDAALLPA